jgi:hypothetical protein
VLHLAYLPYAKHSGRCAELSTCTYLCSNGFLSLFVPESWMTVFCLTLSSCWNKMWSQGSWYIPTEIFQGCWLNLVPVDNATMTLTSMKYQKRPMPPLDPWGWLHSSPSFGHIFPHSLYFCYSQLMLWGITLLFVALLFLFWIHVSHLLHHGSWTAGAHLFCASTSSLPEQCHMRLSLNWHILLTCCRSILQDFF